MYPRLSSEVGWSGMQTQSSHPLLKRHRSMTPAMVPERSLQQNGVRFRPYPVTRLSETPYQYSVRAASLDPSAFHHSAPTYDMLPSAGNMKVASSDTPPIDPVTTMLNGEYAYEGSLPRYAEGDLSTPQATMNGAVGVARDPQKQRTSDARYTGWSSGP